MAEPGADIENRPRRDGIATYRVNTNLEQISDWLTKILVGVGLTQIGVIPERLEAAARILAPGDQDTSFIMALILYSTASGFLLGYLWTRLVIAPMFKEANDKLREKILHAEQTVREAQDTAQQVLDRARALQDVLTEMHDHLYDYEREGFRRAIDAAGLFRRRWGEPKDVMFWIRLAAAYAQQYSWESESEKDIPVQVHQDTKRKALEAIDKALERDRSLAQYWLKYLGDPEFPDRSEGEDDFQIFWTDEDFQRRLQA